MIFHIVFARPNIIDADHEAHDLAVDSNGNILLLDENDVVTRQIAAGQWVEWSIAPTVVEPVEEEPVDAPNPPWEPEVPTDGE